MDLTKILDFYHGLTFQNWTDIGNWSLWGLVICAVIMLVIMAVRKVWYWFTVFSLIAGSVVGGEIVSFVFVKKSISSQYGYWIQAEPVWALAALTFFVAAMLFLALHLYAFGKTRKKLN